MKKSLVALALLASGTAAAQTYDLDIVIAGIEPTPTTIAGSFTYDNGVFTNIDIPMPLASGGTFTTPGAPVDASHVSFVDTYFGSAASGSSSVYVLDFNTEQPLGSKARTIELNDVVLVLAPNINGIYRCGPGADGSIGFACPTATLTTSLSRQASAGPVSAPEPATLSLFTLGLVGVGFTRRRKASRRASLTGTMSAAPSPHTRSAPAFRFPRLPL